MSKRRVSKETLDRILSLAGGRDIERVTGQKIVLDLLDTERELAEVQPVLEAAAEYERAWMAYHEAPPGKGDYIRLTAAEHILVTEVRRFYTARGRQEEG
jgi:hypothetical protein